MPPTIRKKGIVTKILERILGKPQNSNKKVKNRKS